MGITRILTVLFYIFIVFFLSRTIKKSPNTINFAYDGKSSHKPFFSVIIPVYNKLIFLNRSLSSILNQNFSDYELVYSDDGSTDGSVSYIKNISHLYHQIRYTLHKENLGTLNTRVDAIKFAKGQYIVSLDPDDEFDHGLLNELYSYLSKEHYDIIEFQTVEWANESKYLFKNSKSVFLNRKKFMKSKTYWSVVLRCFYREILLKGISYIAPRLLNSHFSTAEDLIIFSYSAVFCYKYLIIDYAGYIYYRNAPGSSSMCTYTSCNKRYKLGRIACNYARDFWKRFNLSFYKVCP